MELLDVVAGEAELVEEAVREVRAQVPAVGRLPAEDVARHTRALMAAAVRAIAERRGPSDAELAFIEQLAVTRADQQVPIEAVLHAIHLAGRRIWTRAREVAATRGVEGPAVLDARDLFDEWSEQVRERLIVTHRAAELARAGSSRDRRVALLRRALEGGTGATAAVAEAGLAPERVWAVHVVPDGDAAAGLLEQRLRTSVHDLFGVLDGRLVGVVAARPAGGDADGPVGLAGPVAADRLDLAARWAQQAWEVARTSGGGATDVVEVPVAAALLGDARLGEHVLDGCRAALEAEGEFGRVLCETVIAVVDHGGDVRVAAGDLVVHVNTVRHRLRRFVEVTGRSLDDPFGAVAAWWLARTYLDG